MSSSLVLPVDRRAPVRVDVWWVDLAAECAERYLPDLDSAETDRAGRMRSAPGFSAFVITRGVLRRLLAGYLGITVRECRFAAGRHGKPRLAAPGRISFNVSHSADRAVLAFTHRAAIGVDVEYLDGRVDVAGLSQRFFAPAENSSLQRLPPIERRQAFFACWTRKEAFVKAVGDGLSHGLADFTVSVTGPAALLSRERRRFRLTDLSCGPDYAAALAVRTRGGAPVIREHRWSASPGPSSAWRPAQLPGAAVAASPRIKPI